MHRFDLLINRGFASDLGVIYSTSLIIIIIFTLFSDSVLIFFCMRELYGAVYVRTQ